ncbi:hypothetical protein LOK49_LG13G00517 [Camellia lanceoleosa]|uniref:Uncharacterized protein n=1 Tax=Camellia lanceoleosa TaxID=1840588 RepID=A0ACC0FJX1_9ERIC|nr:hypothetical protein LOK49_LG13G00517 [Camellia lanceoleosa]
MLKYGEAFAKRMATAGLKPHHRIGEYEHCNTSIVTRVLGDIWADKISGKLVLGFGVIWWSTTTVLIPIAARVGLPFLLVMRAFMGIGEGKPLSKVKISGGGRCNVTNGHCSDNLILAEHYPGGNKELGSFFSMHGPKDAMSWFSDLGVKRMTEDDGRVFPVSNNSSSVVDCLLSEAKQRGDAVWTLFSTKPQSTNPNI